MESEGKRSFGWLYGLVIGLIVTINVVPLAVEYFSVTKGNKSHFMDFHLTDEYGHDHTGIIGMATFTIRDGEIFQYGYQVGQEDEVAKLKKKINRDQPDENGFHWGDRGYIWSDILNADMPSRRGVSEGERLGLKIEPWQMAEVTGPGAPWDIKGPHMSFLGVFPEYDIEYEDEYFKFDLKYRTRSVGWHLSNQGSAIRAGDFGKGHMNELPCDVSGTITHKKKNITFTVFGWGFLEDANGTWNWFEWGGHHYFTSHYENGWAVSFWLAQEDWQWGSEQWPREVWVYDADRQEFYNGYNIEVLNMEWEREEINDVDFAKSYRIRAVTSGGVVDITASSVTFKPIFGPPFPLLPLDVVAAYSKGTMEGTFTYLDGSRVALNGVGMMENFQRFMPNMIYITPWSLIVLSLLIGGRRIAKNKDDKVKVKQTIWLILLCIAAVALLTHIWM